MIAQNTASTLLNLLYLSTSILGFITIFLIGSRFKSNRHTNFYLVVFFALSTVRFFLRAEANLYFQNYITYLDFLQAISAWPLLYLYFLNLVSNTNKINSKELFAHLSIPLVLSSLFCIKGYVQTDIVIKVTTILFPLGLLYEIFYTYKSFKLLKDNVWKRNSDILLINRQNKAISKWTKVLFSLFILMMIRFLIGILFRSHTSWYNNQNNFLWFAAVLWIILYVSILRSTEFLYGYELFQNKIREHKKHNIIFDNVWVTDPSKIVINIQDGILKEKIAVNIQTYIIEIEHLALNTSLFFSETFATEDLARKLNIPKSHLLYVFKYHTLISFSDFKKIIRVQKTISMIHDQYLQNNTMESLAAAVGFSSYSSFFKSFKAITGLSPQGYCQNIE